MHVKTTVKDTVGSYKLRKGRSLPTSSTLATSKTRLLDNKSLHFFNVRLSVLLWCISSSGPPPILIKSSSNLAVAKMGIPGLLQFIKDASEPIHVKKYKGQTVAVDTYCWLHKGAFSCAEKLAKGEPTEQYVFYCMKFVDMLLSFDVKPILVFDGCNLPSKQDVDKSRRERRQANLQKGKQLLREGKLSEARDCFTRAVNITPAMAHNLIKAARTRGVDCVVAPYEADAQLAFLSKSGMAQAIITEDSDLLAFGCQKVILKMDKEGNGLEIDQSHLGRCRSLGDVFTEEKFRYMCILSGCDYLASLYGIGLGKACKLLKIANNPDILKVIKKIGQYLKMNVVVPEEYIEGFIKANNTFLYQLVFDPVKRKIVPLNPYPDHLDPATLSYAGCHKGDEKGLQMALGNLDFHTMETIDDFNPDKVNMQVVQKPRSRSWNATRQASRSPARPSIWSRGYVPGSSALPQPVAGSPERPPTTRGQERVVTLQGLRLPSRELQVKRPREDSSISDQDVLQQYTGSSQKRARSEEQPASPRPAATSPPVTAQVRPRNRFATLLQRRNQDVEGDGQGIRSRFFSGPSDMASLGCGDTVVKEELSEHVLTGAPSQATNESSTGILEENPQTGESDGPEAPSVDTPSPTSPPTSPPSPSVQPASQGLGVFRWSGTSPTTERCRTLTTPGSGLTTLQQFQRKKESFSWNKTPNPHPTLSPPISTARNMDSEDKDPLSDSPTSQDSAYFSQSQPCLASCPKGEVPSLSSPPHLEDAMSEMKCVIDSHPDQSPASTMEADKKLTMMKSKVTGLPRVKPSDQGKAKLRPSGPARASGLRRKPSGPGGKAASGNENSLGLQATISGLWKNFGFKKENPRMDTCKKGEPLSPVKDNMMAVKDIIYL